MYFTSDENAKKLEEDKKGCGMIVTKTKDGEVKCGQEMWGKKRYCAYCSQKTSEANK